MKKYFKLIYISYKKIYLNMQTTNILSAGITSEIGISLEIILNAFKCLTVSLSTEILILAIAPLSFTGGPQKCPYFSLAKTFTEIRKPSRLFLHRYWKFIELFLWKPL